MKKISYFISRIFYLLLVFVLVFSSCSKDENEDETTVMKYTKVSSLSQATIIELLGSMGSGELTDKVKYSIDVYTCTYSTEYKGKSITASGLICVPLSSGQEFPLLSFQHGTMVAHYEAPSLTYNQLQTVALEAVASMGYVVAIPDEIGFGSSSDYLHPYLVKESNVSAVTDMLQSMREIPKGDLSGSNFNDSLFLMGYSHGGWVTMATLNELESQNTNNWDIIATACGAGPYYPEMVAEYTFSKGSYEKPFFFAYGIMSYLDNGSLSNPLTDFYKEPYATNIPAMFDGSQNGVSIDGQLSQNNAELYTDDFLNTYPTGKFSQLQSVLQLNQTNAWKNSTPLLLLHGENDTYIPQSVSDSIYQNFMNIGSNNVEYEVIPEKDHNTAAIPSIISTLIWFESYR